MSDLKHYGVKGMKWGVRRTKEELGYKVYRKLEGDTVLDKGTKFQRIGTASNTGYTKGVYTSYRSKDKDLYKGVLGRMRLSYLAQTGEKVRLNELTMEARRDIRLPNRKTRLDTFKKLYERDGDDVSAFINEHERSRYGKNFKKPNLNNSKDLEKAYQKFNDALAMGSSSKNKNVITRYYYELQKQGYNAIPDENDIRLSTFKANAPIILFNTKQSIGKTTVRELSASEVFSAYDRTITKKTVRDILMRKGVGIEKLSPDTTKKAQKYAEQLRKDMSRLGKNYTIEDLAEDWGKNRLSSSQIKRVAKRMDEGMSHADAVAKEIGLGNVIVDLIFDRLKL